MGMLIFQMLISSNDLAVIQNGISDHRENYFTNLMGMYHLLYLKVVVKRIQLFMV